MALLAALVLMLGSAPTISLSTASTCAPREVLSQELGAAGVSFVSEGGVVLRLENDGSLTLEKEGRVVLSRSLGSGTCEELGRAAAVVVVRWVHALEVTKPVSLSPAGERVGERGNPPAKPPLPADPPPRSAASPNTKPELAKPSLAKPSLAKPELAKPELAKPELAKPELAKPSLAKPELAKLELAKPELAKPELAKPDLAKPELAKPELAKPELAKPELAKPELAKPELAKPELAKPELAKPSAPTPPSPTPEIPRDRPRDSVVATIGTTPPTTDPVADLPLSPTLSPAGERGTVRVTSWEALAGGGLTAPGTPDPAPLISLELALTLNERLRIDLAGLFDFGGHTTVFDEAGLTRGTLTTRGGLIIPGAGYCLLSPVRLCVGALAGLRIVEGESSGPYVFNHSLSRVVAFVVGPNAQLAFTPGPFRVALDASLLVTPVPPGFSVEGLPTTLRLPVFQGLFRLSIGFGVSR